MTLESNTPNKPCIWCGSRKYPRWRSYGGRMLCADKQACLERRRAK